MAQDDKARQDGARYCIVALLSIIALLLAGILVAFAGIAWTVMPVLRTVHPIILTIDPEAIRPVAASAANIVLSVDQVLGNFSIEDLQLVPSNIPALLISAATINVGSFAWNVSRATSGIVSAIQSMTITERDRTGDEFANIATFLSAASSLTYKLKDWKPTSPAPPRVAPPASNANPESDPWHGLPSMIFGKSPVDWLYDQSNPDAIKAIGGACSAILEQFKISQVLAFSYEQYGYDWQTGKISPEQLYTPIPSSTSQTIVNTMAHICDGLGAAAKYMEVAWARPRNTTA